ncbi:hypothetical protein [Streptomyces sp. V1I6]|jgi:hypothetical protein|uniref:hypothetical protein n=1 Tax=Streptomyces sp. V1I6 TaxID=3042273 RepID=UPI002787B2A3|nr:hypothetical protein [Streptomyces sp. V1I6]MDQ0841925.1 hypothetical protein [Streptomyces sp. V1I6]
MLEEHIFLVVLLWRVRRSPAEEVLLVRTTWRKASALAAATVLVLGITCTALHFRQETQDPRPAQPPSYEARCSTVVEGSRVTAYCHNPYPAADRVRLHVECDRWWDVDADTAPVLLRPAEYGELTGRCWKEIRSVWISHQPPRADAGT